MTFSRILGEDIEIFSRREREKRNLLREEMLILLTIGKRKFHEESFSFDFLFFSTDESNDSVNSLL